MDLSDLSFFFHAISRRSSLGLMEGSSSGVSTVSEASSQVINTSHDELVQRIAWKKAVFTLTIFYLFLLKNTSFCVASIVQHTTLLL